MIIKTATNALDYKNEAISLWHLMEGFIGADHLIPDRVTWHEDLMQMREAIPILWSPEFMKVAVVGARQLFQQKIPIPSGCLPKDGHWHICGEPITSLVNEDGRRDLVDSVIIKPVQRYKSGKNVIKIEVMTSLYGPPNCKPAIVAGFDWEMDQTIDDVVAEAAARHKDDPYWPNEVRAICFWIMAAEIFLAQRVFAVDKGHIERHTRKRIEKAGEIPPEVHVVRLRKYANCEPNTKAEAKEVEWTCRWMVRGHWTNQWYPSEGVHRPLWIMPYVKGPEDKPFREPLPSVGVVVR